MRKFVKKAAAALLAGTMAMSLAACAGFTPSGGDDKKDAPASSEAILVLLRLLRNQERRKP